MIPIDILFITSGATAGGAERQLLHFLQHHDRRRFTCRVLTVLAADSESRRGGADFRPLLRDCGVPVQSLNLPRFPTAGGLLALRRALRTQPASVVQSYGLAVDLAVRCLPSGTRLLIGTMRGPEEQRPTWLFRLDGLTSWRLRGYISNSECGKAALVRKGRIAPGRVQVIPNGIDPEAFATPQAAAARQRLRADFRAGDDDILVLTVANLHAAKGHEDIIRAMAALDPRHRMRVLFAGEDRSGGRLAQLAHELGVQARILFLGHRTDVAELMAASDVFLLASHWEGMSNALMEAMCASLPAIATDVGAARELLAGGRCGQLIPARDPAAIVTALCRYAADRPEALAGAAAAHARIHECYSIQTMVRAHEAFYESLFRQPATP